MAAEMDGAQARADRAEAARAAAETDRDAAVGQARFQQDRPTSSAKLVIEQKSYSS
jgi:hypothetical protein